MKNLVSYLNKNFSLSPNAAEKMADIISIVEIEKGEVFVKKGRNSINEFIILDGICRSYLCNSNDDEVTLSFFTRDSAISPNVTRTVLDKSILNLQALSHVSVGIFASQDLMNLMRSYREIEIWGNAILQNELMNKVTKEINQISLPAKERLLDFRERFEALENLIPHSYIASYLGITNVSLSRIRKDLAE